LSQIHFDELTETILKVLAIQKAPLFAWSNRLDELEQFMDEED
jgi:hypothetical protein